MTSQFWLQLQCFIFEALAGKESPSADDIKVCGESAEFHQ